MFFNKPMLVLRRKDGGNKPLCHFPSKLDRLPTKIKNHGGVKRLCLLPGFTKEFLRIFMGNVYDVPFRYFSLLLGVFYNDPCLASCFREKLVFANPKFCLFLLHALSNLESFPNLFATFLKYRQDRLKQ